MTDAVLEEVTEWQQRPLLPLYPVISFDALRVRIRDEGTVRAKAVYLALGRKYPPIAPAWRRHWEQVIPLFAHPPEIRRILYTTNAIESLDMQLRKALKIRGHFPTDEAATKLIYLVLRNITRRWRQAPREWKAAMNQFAILSPDRFLISG